MNKRNDFICIGAAHSDFILRLKQDYFKNRTNPIKQLENLGGVAYNIAKILSFLNQNTKLYSLNCNHIQKKEIIKLGIKFKPLSKEIFQRYYTSILNKNGKMILGLANMDEYEKVVNHNLINNYQNKKIILDLNFSLKLIKNIINNNYKNNLICICGTSTHKVNKIKKLLNKINLIVLNKQESLQLTGKQSIKAALLYLIKNNSNLVIVITNGKYAVHAYENKKIYLCPTPNIKVSNENGAGDALTAYLNYFYSKSITIKDSLVKSVVAGALQASNYKNNKKKYLQKIDSLSKEIKIKVSNYYE